MTDTENQPPQTKTQDGYSSDRPPVPYYPPGDGPQFQPPPYMPPPYMPPPYPTNAVIYPPALPPQPGFVTNYGTPGEPGFSKPEEQLPPVEGVDSSPTEEAFLTDTTFEDKTIRRAFIRKVFSVVTIQLLVTFSVVCVFTFSAPVRTAVQKNIWVYLSSYIIFMVVCVCLSVWSGFSRTHPWNLVGLTVVTLSLSFLVGTVASYHNTTAVIIAMGSTLVISFTIIIFSAQTRVDFTLCHGILLVVAMDLVMFGLFSCFFYSSALQIVYGSLGALLYAMFLAVDCQLVMGREKYSLSPEEYVFAALIIYLDIITIFLYLLILLGGSSSN